MKKKLITIICYLILLCSFNLNPESFNKIEKKFIDAGLINIQSIDTSLQVDLVNSDSDKNFFRENYYNSLNKAYLRKEVALKLSNAQKLLKSKYPKYSLLILDAARPRSVSKLMYDKMKGTKFEKYVANPETGSMHNYGISVDLTIVNEKKEQLDMGFTPFFKSDLKIYWQFIKMKLSPQLNKEQCKNRKLLSDIMISSGFNPLSYEWWHFDGLSKSVTRQKYKIIE